MTKEEFIKKHKKNVKHGFDDLDGADIWREFAVDLDELLRDAKLDVIDKCIWWTKYRPPCAGEPYAHVADNIGIHLRAGRERVSRGENFDSTTSIDD